MPAMPFTAPFGLAGYASATACRLSTNCSAIAFWRVSARQARRRRRIRRAPHRAQPQSAAPNPPSRRATATSTALIRTRLVRASNCSERLRTNRGQCAAPGMIDFRCANIWQPLHTPRLSVSACEEGRERVANACVIQDRLRPATAAAQHVAIRESAARDEHLEIASSVRRSSSRSDMCTSIGSKPARSNTAAISR